MNGIYCDEAIREEFEGFFGRSNIETEHSIYILYAERPESFESDSIIIVNGDNKELLKSLAGEYDVEKIVATKKGAAFVFRDANVFKEQNLLSAVAKLTEDVVLTATVPPQLLFNTKGMTVEQVVEKMINFLLITQKS